MYLAPLIFNSGLVVAAFNAAHVIPIYIKYGLLAFLE